MRYPRPALKHPAAIVLVLLILAACAPGAPSATMPAPSQTAAAPQPSHTAPPQPSATPTTAPTNPPTATQPSPQVENQPGRSQVAGLLEQINAEQVTTYMQSLTGMEALLIGAAPVWIESRADEENLDELTRALYEFLQAQGLEVSYQEWYDEETESGGRNVIGELPGASRPDEIVILCAHIDSACDEAICPGADDNASGATGVLLAAQLLPQMRFERSLRFVFFTGEEIDLLGSYYYAQELRANDENVVAVVNLDMLGWDGDGDGTVLLYTRTCRREACSPDRAIADTFLQAVEDYQIAGLRPRLARGEEDGSDAYSFWEVDYPAILAIEDDQDEENPYYHSAQDTLDTLDQDYLTAFIRAVVATAAELAGPLAP